MSVVDHVGGVEGVVGHLAGGQIGLELGGGDDVGAAGGVLGDRVVDDEGVVLAEVQAVVLEAGEAGGGGILLVSSPGETLGLEEIDNGLVGIGDGVEVIVVQSEVVSTGSSDVVGLRRVGDTGVLVEEHTLGNEGGQGSIGGSLGVVLEEEKEKTNAVLEF